MSIQSEVYRYLRDHPGRKVTAEDVAEALPFDRTQALQALYRLNVLHDDIQRVAYGVYRWHEKAADQHGHEPPLPMVDVLLRQGTTLLLRDSDGTVLVCRVLQHLEMGE